MPVQADHLESWRNFTDGSGATGDHTRSMILGSCGYGRVAAPYSISLVHAKLGFPTSYRWSRRRIELLAAGGRNSVWIHILEVPGSKRLVLFRAESLVAGDRNSEMVHIMEVPESGRLVLFRTELLAAGGWNSERIHILEVPESRRLCAPQHMSRCPGI